MTTMQLRPMGPTSIICACGHSAAAHSSRHLLRQAAGCVAADCDCGFFAHPRRLDLPWWRRHRLELFAAVGFPVGFGIGKLILWQFGDALRAMIWGA